MGCRRRARIRGREPARMLRMADFSNWLETSSGEQQGL